jgi:hypothetical protein
MSANKVLERRHGFQTTIFGQLFAENSNDEIFSASIPHPPPVLSLLDSNSMRSRLKSLRRLPYISDALFFRQYAKRKQHFCGGTTEA